MDGLVPVAGMAAARAQIKPQESYLGPAARVLLEVFVRCNLNATEVPALRK